MTSPATRSLAAVALAIGLFSATACSPSAEGTSIPEADPKGNPGGGTSGGVGTSGGTPAPDPTSDAGPGSTTDASTAPVTYGFPAKWIDGTACGTDPTIQTWKYSEDTFILRQSLCTTFEGPFMYLFVGATKALLVDTGTGGVDLRGEVTKLLAGKAVQLVVAHSHSHGDHVSGDSAFKGQANTTVVGLQATAVKQFFGITGDGAAAFDLGGRVVDVLADPRTPGRARRLLRPRDEAAPHRRHALPGTALHRRLGFLPHERAAARGVRRRAAPGVLRARRSHRAAEDGRRLRVRHEAASERARARARRRGAAGARSSGEGHGRHAEA